MNYNDVAHWKNAIDEADDETREHIALDMPALAVGETWTDTSGRVWQQVAIEHGKPGGRWCYLREIGNRRKIDGVVIVDDIFNGWTERFVGMLRIPYDGHVTEALMLRKGWYEKTPNPE